MMGLIFNMEEAVLVVDALAHGAKGKRIVTVDVIGAGPRTVAGVLEARGISVELMQAEEFLRRPSKAKEFSTLFVSGMSVDEPTVARVIKCWRRHNKGLVVVGGPIASDPMFLLRVNGDIGVYGEAELVVEKLTEKGIVTGDMRRDEIPQILSGMCGVVYRAAGSLKVNRRCPIMPRWVWERYKPSTRAIKGYRNYWAARVYVEVVRGCSNYTFPKLDDILPRELLPDKPRPGCAYCSVIPLYGYARSRSIENVVREVKELIDIGVRRIVLSGPDFLDYGRDWLVEPNPLVNPHNPPPNVEAIRKLLRELHSISEISSGEAVVMVENAKPTLVDEEVARVLGEYLKGTPIHIGAEVGDNRLLAKLGRPATTYDAIRAVKLLRKYGLRPYVYVMYCLPGEDGLVVRRTVELIEKLYNAGAEKVTAYKFTPLPLSYLEKLAKAQLKCPSPHPVRLKAEEVNRRAKKKLIGSILKVVIAGVHPKYRRPVAYPLMHGPVVLLDRGEIGAVAKVRVSKVLDDRLVEATLLDVIDRVKTKS